MAAPITLLRSLLLAVLSSLVLVATAAMAQPDAEEPAMEARLAAAADHWGSGDPQTARAALRELLAELPGWPAERSPWSSAARVRLGDIAWRLGDDRRAGGHYLRVVETEPESRWTGDARLGLARTFAASGDRAAAIQILQELLEGSAEAGQRASAEDHLVLLDRLEVRPAAGESSWRSCDLISTEATEPGKLVGLTLTADGSLLVAGKKGVLRLGEGGSIERQIAWSSSGSPFVDTAGLAYLIAPDSVLQLEGERHSFVGGRADRPRPLTDIRAGGRDAWGRWVLAPSRGDGPLLFDPQGGYLTTLVGPSALEVVDIALDARGRLLLLDAGGSRVLRLDFETLRPKVVLSDTWKRPQGIAVDPYDNLYVLDRGQQEVLVYRADGEPLARLGPQLRGGCELRAPEDLAVDARGRIFVADSREKAVVVID